MDGLLDFAASPAGQGLLGAVFSGLAGARRGAPLNSLGAAGAGGLLAYNQAQQNQAEAAKDMQRSKFFDMQIQQMQEQQAQQKAAQEALQRRQGYLGSLGQVTSPRVDAQPNQFDPMAWIRMGGSLEEAKSLAGMNRWGKPEPVKIAQGETLLDPSTMKPIYSAPRETAPTEMARLIRERDSLPDGSPLRGLYDSALNKQATHQPGTSVSVNTGQKGFDNEIKLRSDFRSEPVYKAHQEMSSAYSQIQQSLKQGTPSGDLAGATKIMKLLDPGSVVRESELGMAMAATGLLDRAQNYANMIVTGQKLTPQQRVDFQGLADALYSESVKAYNSKRDEYTGIANDYGMNPSRIAGPASVLPANRPLALKPGSSGGSDLHSRAEEIIKGASNGNR